MKIVTPKVMAVLESRAYLQGYSEKDFMENAGSGIAHEVDDYVLANKLSKTIWLLCGKGNNGGDAYVAGRYLLEKGYHVIAIQPEDIESCSPLCKENSRRFAKLNGKIVHTIDSFGTSGLILDGLFGTGFKGQLREPYASLVDKANKSGLPIIAVDIPSGLNGASGVVEGNVIRAAATIFLGLPKTGFFLEDGWNVIGKLRRVDFGLPASIIDQGIGDFELMTKEDAAHLLPPIIRNRHKYQAGFVIGLAGSYTMPGAAILSSLAAFRGGAGMVRLLHPQGMEAELSSSPPELIKIPYALNESGKIVELLEKAGAAFIGPGLGRSRETQDLLKAVIPCLKIPAVIDADALTLFAEHPFKLPANAIFTPHMGEMQTLLKSPSRLKLDLDLLKICQKYAEKHNVTLILKGAPTFVFHPRTPIMVNPTGDPGMATAGSGDVLTGLLAALQAQGLSTREAALLGVYLHGLAGEFAAEKRGTSYGVMATDIIAHFSEAYKVLHEKSVFHLIVTRKSENRELRGF